ncbi:uncharacterized protein LOC129720059 [Wyeomyia smithii]|uniref:uncharacterized protein LOC129720059 n=1 Tax=Wyeomyia smithii TaxID=174621 RepID=UPI002467FD80|nr:uncharacterized protein LOC129720059 [Wyeomyia smithii]
MVNLIDSKGQAIPCRAFLDCGAQTNLISHEMYRKLGLEGLSVNIDVLGVSNARFKVNRLDTVKMNSQHTDYETNLKCLVVPRITSHLPCRSIDIANWKIPSGLRLADPSFNKPSDVDLLIGITHFFPLMKPGQYVIDHGLAELREKELGWVVSGEVHDIYDPVINSQSVNAVSIESLNEMIKRFWEVEELQDAVLPQAEEHPCKKIFRKTYRRNDSGRFIVDLPLRDNVDLLDRNRSSALRRFFFLEKRLQQNPEHFVLPIY